jgi:hypothetical protein
MGTVSILVREAGEYSDRTVVVLCAFEDDLWPSMKKYCTKMPRLIEALRQAYEKTDFDYSDKAQERRDQLHRRAHRLDPTFADREYGEGQQLAWGAEPRYHIEEIPYVSKP